MENTQKTITEYVIDENESLILHNNEKNTLVYHHNKKNESLKLIAKGPAPLENEASEVEKVAAALMQMNDHSSDFNEKKLIEANSDIWKSCGSETEFLAKLAFMVAGTIKNSYENMMEAGPGNGFKLDESDLEVASLKAMHKLGEILFSAQAKNGAVNAKANLDDKPNF